LFVLWRCIHDLLRVRLLRYFNHVSLSRWNRLIRLLNRLVGGCDRLRLLNGSKLCWLWYAACIGRFLPNSRRPCERLKVRRNRRIRRVAGGASRWCHLNGLILCLLCILHGLLQLLILWRGCARLRELLRFHRQVANARNMYKLLLWWCNRLRTCYWLLNRLLNRLLDRLLQWLLLGWLPSVHNLRGRLFCGYTHYLHWSARLVSVLGVSVVQLIPDSHELRRGDGLDWCGHVGPFNAIWISHDRNTRLLRRCTPRAASSRIL